MKSQDPSPVELWDRFWTEGSGGGRPSPIVDEIRKLCGGQPVGKRVLEVGAGSGRDIVAVATLGADAFANDISSSARDRISSLARARGVNVMIDGSDLRCLPFPDGYFDVVYSQGVLEHFRDIAVIVAEQARVIKPVSGRLIIDVPQTFNPYTIYKHILMKFGRWKAGWETQFTPSELVRVGQRAGLVPIDLYSWGEHGRLSGIILSPLDRWPWTATSIGVIFSKSASS